VINKSEDQHLCRCAGTKISFYLLVRDRFMRVHISGSHLALDVLHVKMICAFRNSLARTADLWIPDDLDVTTPHLIMYMWAGRGRISIDSRTRY